MRSHVEPLHATLSMFQEDVILFRVDQVAIDFFFGLYIADVMPLFILKVP